MYHGILKSTCKYHGTVSSILPHTFCKKLSKTMVLFWASDVALIQYHIRITWYLHCTTGITCKKNTAVRFYITFKLINLNNRITINKNRIIIIIAMKCKPTGRCDTFTSERRVGVRGRRSTVLQSTEPGAVVLDHGDLVLLLGQKRRRRVFFCMNSVVGGQKAKVVSHV